MIGFFIVYFFGLGAVLSSFTSLRLFWTKEKVVLHESWKICIALSTLMLN